MCGQQSKDYANIKKRTCCSLGKHLLNSTGALSDLLRTTVLTLKEEWLHRKIFKKAYIYNGIVFGQEMLLC